MAEAYHITTKAKIHSSPNSGKANFHQRRSGTPATVSTVMVVPLAGVIMLVKASPIWKASTAVYRVRPTRSARGAMMGMVMAAWPEPEGTTRLNTSWTMNMPKPSREWGNTLSPAAR